MAKSNVKYGLFKKENGKWVRECCALAYPLPQARQLFQTLLLIGPNRELRPAVAKPLA